MWSFEGRSSSFQAVTGQNGAKAEKRSHVLSFVSRSRLKEEKKGTKKRAREAEEAVNDGRAARTGRGSKMADVLCGCRWLNLLIFRLNCFKFLYRRERLKIQTSATRGQQTNKELFILSALKLQYLTSFL